MHWTNKSQPSFSPPCASTTYGSARMCIDERMGGWLVLIPITHGSNLSHKVMFAYRCWSEICLIDENLLGIPASFTGCGTGCSKQSHSNCTCSHVKTLGVRFVKTVNIKFTDNLSTFPITKSLWSHFKLLLICLIELGFGFDHSFPRGKPVGKSPYYRSCDRSAYWRVKDSVYCAGRTAGHPSALLCMRLLGASF